MERPVLTHELADYENPYMMKRTWALVAYRYTIGAIAPLDPDRA